ncbi:MAG: RsmB/NOP family class I SAM-dependent RNA methyltransferase [Magnetococcales bacterium]|nr:RsmB/NOP family class I SAM-dependent RNA methyltransferase [Magnetococcales bacterium]MBF0322832.1 RsmB/NOP family class I SAM-dependent RNA methyltransferase [Magnetococcales bacterium]
MNDPGFVFPANPTRCVRLTVKLLGQILDSATPPETLMTHRFWVENGCGSKERAWIGDLVHGVLRHRRRLDPDLSSPAAHLTALALLDMYGWSPSQIAEVCGRTAPQPLSSPTDHAAPIVPAIRHSLPDWLWEALTAFPGGTEAEELAAALNQPAPIDLRVNLRIGTRAACQADLLAEGIATTWTPFSPSGLRLTHRTPLGGSDPFRRGWIEIQDEGSQLISLLVAPKPGQTVVDLCAGGGGKSLHLAMLMEDRGRIVAADSHAQRLARLRPRQRRAGLRSIHPLPIRHEGDPKLHALAGKADRVLLDVPCSGTGTLRRHPEYKWSLRPQDVTTLTLRQSALLTAGARLVKPGGRLIYATCSILEQENQAVVDYFLRCDPGFRLLDAAHVLASSGVAGDVTRGPFLSLWPHRHGTDGFFAAIMERKR